jgi:hypothetical protein
MSPTDLKLIENHVTQLRKFCNLWSVDSSLFNDPANKTFNNRKEATKALYNEAVLPVLNRFLTGLNIWLLPEWSRLDNKNYTIEADTSGIESLQEDKEKEAQRVERTSKEIRALLESVRQGKTTPDAARDFLIEIHSLTEQQAEKLTAQKEEDPAAQNVQTQSMNGAQVTAMVAIAQAVNMGELNRESAVRILISAFNIDEQTAKRIIP